MSAHGGLSLVERARVTFKPGRNVFGRAEIGPGTICVDEVGERVWAFDRSTLARLWNRAVEWPKLVCASGVGVVVSYKRECEGWAWDGRPLWRRDRGWSLPATGGRFIEVREGRLSVVDAETGETHHSVSVPEARPDILTGSTVLLKRPTDGIVHAFDLESGSALWAKDLTASIRMAYGLDSMDAGYPVLGLAPASDKRFLCARAGHIFGVSVLDGRVVWCADVPLPYRAACAQDGKVFAWSTAPVSKTTTFDLSTGAVQQEMVGATGNRWVILDEATGAVLLDRDLGEYGPEFAAHQRPSFPTLGVNHIVFTTDAGLVAIFRLSDGELVWRHQLQNEAFEAAVADNELFIACSDGTLYAFECQDGDL